MKKRIISLLSAIGLCLAGISTNLALAVNETVKGDAMFKYADDGWALDPNQNGVLSNSDSVAILQYIADGSSYSGNIGKKLYHCYYGYYY